MFNGFVRLGVCLALPVFALAICRPVWGQIQFPTSGIILEKSEYNDLVYKVNVTADHVFASAEGRKAGASELLTALDRLVPMVQEKVNQPKSRVEVLAKPILAQQIKLYNLFRLALDEPSAAAAYEVATAKGGRSAALASVDRAAADWLNAGQNSQAQSAAFEMLRAAIKASGQNVSWQYWNDLLDFNPPASDTVGTPLLAYLQPYCNDTQSGRMLIHWKVLNKMMELDGKPFTIEGTLLSGAHFSTATWKGKVILIDGWATCFPRDVTEGFPPVQSILAEHHAQGLEVLGMAYGQTVTAAKTMLAGHPEFTFAQMYDPNHRDIAEVCAGTTSFGLRGEIFGPSRVIDRKGVLHYIHDEKQLEAEVVNYLAQAQ
jgi:hypothetical protein